VDLSARTLVAFRKVCRDADEEPLANLADRVAQTLGPGPHMDFNAFLEAVAADADTHNIKLPAKRGKMLQTHLATRDECAEPVIKKKGKDGIEYEPDPNLRDTEQVPLLEEGGIEAFFNREVVPHVPDAWIDHAKTQIGYEISFTRHFYKPAPLRSLDEIRADLLALQKEGEGLMDDIVGGGVP